MCHNSRSGVALGSWSGSPHSRRCSWQQCMSQGVVLLRLAGDRSGWVSVEAKLLHQLVLVSTALYSTALRQMSTVITYLQYTRQCIQYCTVGLHCTICNTIGEYCRCNMHTSFSMSHAREKPLVEWCCTTDYVPTYPPTTWSCLTVSDKTHPATAASRTPRKKAPYASRLC